MDPERLRYAFHGHVLTETLQGFDGPLAITFLLFGSLVCVALLLIVADFRGAKSAHILHRNPQCF